MVKAKLPIPKKQLKPLRRFLRELEWSTTKKYVELLRDSGCLLSIGQVDVDVPQIVHRPFVCDAQRCINWAGDTALVDRSCCSRYEVPVTTDDRARLRSCLEAVREVLPDDHPLQDGEISPFSRDEDYGYNLIGDNPLGGCQFNEYVDGRCRCAVHHAALEQGEAPVAWKPLACSLWPLAVSDYDDDGEERFLLTIYCEETNDLFSETDAEPFACLQDQDPSYPPLYRSERAVIEHLFGRDFWRRLDAAARKLDPGTAEK